MTTRGRRRRIVYLTLAVAVFGCATRQRIPIDCVPDGATVYVDGVAQEGLPTSLELDPRRPHTVYFKSDETIPELVVLESVEVDGKPRLLPAEVCAQPPVVRARRMLRVEIDPGTTAEGDDDAGTVDLEARPDFVPYRP
jgi:hypothetical protein